MAYLAFSSIFPSTSQVQLDLPEFKGLYPLDWLRTAELFFEEQRVPLNERPFAARRVFDGEALEWFKVLEKYHCHRVLNDWALFKEAIHRCFGYRPLFEVSVVLNEDEGLVMDVPMVPNEDEEFTNSGVGKPATMVDVELPITAKSRGADVVHDCPLFGMKKQQVIETFDLHLALGLVAGLEDVSATHRLLACARYLYVKIHQQEWCSWTLVINAVLSWGFCEEQLQLKIVIGRVYDPGGHAMNNSVIVVLNKLDKTKDVTEVGNGKEILAIILELQEENWNAYKVIEKLLPKRTSRERNLEQKYLNGEHMIIMADCNINGYQVLSRLFYRWKEEIELVKGELGFLPLDTYSMRQGALLGEQSTLNMPRKQHSVPMGGTTSLAIAVLEKSMNWSTIKIPMEVGNEGNNSRISQTPRETKVCIAIHANHFPFDPGRSKDLALLDFTPCEQGVF